MMARHARQLRYFIAIAEELNVSRAAARLRVAQPALSRQLRALEGRIGAPLFERSRRGVRLTDVGAVFLREARAAVEQEERAFLIGRRAAEGHVGNLRIAFSSAAIFHPLVAQLIRRYRQTWPEVQTSAEEIPPGEQISALRTEKVDAGFFHLDQHSQPAEEMFRAEQLTLHRLAVEREVLAVAIANPLARRTSVQMAELVDETFLALPPNARVGDTGPMQRLAALHHGALRIALHVHTLPALVHLAAAGVGVAVVPESIRSIRLPGLRYVPVEDDSERRVLVLGCRSGEQPPAVANLLRLADAASAEPARPAAA
jgi:DNA-binding transcriptional LysR family regulator